MHRSCSAFVMMCVLVSASLQPVAQAQAQGQVATEDTRKACALIASKLASISEQECLARGLLPTGHYSVEKTPILYKEYPPLEERKALGRVLLVSGVHGDEYASVSIAFKWLKTLDKYHSGMFHWHVAPLVNPDGLLRARPQRVNANGVDLNRNLPTPDWKDESVKYWKKTGYNPRRYPGPAPGSEPETRWLVEKIEEFAPDIIVTVHAPYGIVDYDGPQRPPKRLGRLNLQRLGTFPGSLGRYAGIHKKIPVVTIELGSAGRMPSKEEISRIWMDLVQWMKKTSRNIHAASAEDFKDIEAASNIANEES